MSRPHPARFFRAATALGVLAAGLAVPAAASAEPAPLVAPMFQYTDKADAAHGPVVSVLHGAFTGGFDGSTRQQVAAVADSGLDRTDQFAPAGVALFDRTPGGFARTGDVSLALDQPIASVAGELEPEGGSSVVVVGRRGAAYAIESVDWHDGPRHRTAVLPAEPVSVVVGRFLPGVGRLAAVSLVDGRIVFLAPKEDDRDALELVFVSDVPVGPLAVATRASGPGDALMASDGPSGKRIEFDQVQDYWEPRESGTVAGGFGLSAGRIASDTDPYGNRWYTTRVNGKSFLNWFAATKDAQIGENGGWLTTARELSAPMVMNLYGGPERDVAASLDGDLFHAVDIASGRTAQGGITSSTIATALDVDADRRDDLVIADGTGVTLYRNDTGTYENRPELEARSLVPSMFDAVTHGQIVTSKTFDFVVPKDTDDRYQCQIGDGEWVDCVGTTQGVRALSVPSNGAYKLHVRRMAAGTEFWSAEQSIGFRVEAPIAKPTIVEGPAEITRSVKYRITPPAGARVEYRLDNATAWEPTAVSPDGDVYLGFANLLQDGSHKVTFRAVDTSSDTPSETVVSTFLLDTKAPAAPKKIFGPTGETTARKATFAFEGENGGNFECRLAPRSADRVAARTIDAWQPCLDTFSVEDLTLGEHVVEVRQTDAAGNHGPAATWTWTVVPATPDVVVTPLPTAPEVPTKEVVPVPTAATPAPTPVAPAKAADPRPQPEPAKAAEPKAVAAKLSVGAPAGKGKTPTATSTGRRVAVGCAAPGAEGYRCAVTVTRNGKTVGEGRRTGAGVVPVNLDKATARKVQRLGGLKVRVTLTVKTADGETTKTQKTVRLLPKKVLVVPTDGLFAFDSATPSKGADALAKQIAGQLDGARTITIVGHTDAKGSAQVNERLGRERAEAFRRLLAKHGFRGRVAVESAGDTKPRASNATEGGRELNRRVEIEVRY